MPSNERDASAVLVTDSTIYFLNAQGYNRWSANVQPGQDDDGKRISDEECKSIARALAATAPNAGAPLEEMSPDFTDTARAALLWVLWHHQGGSSKVGQPIRFALGMGQHDHLNDHQIGEANRWAAIASAPAPAQQAGAPLPLAPRRLALGERIEAGDLFPWGDPITWEAVERSFVGELVTEFLNVWRPATPQQALPLAPSERGNALEPVVSLGFDKVEDGTYSARLTVSGLPSEQQAQAAVDHMQRLFCGQEQAARQ